MNTHIHVHKANNSEQLEIAHEGDDLILSVDIENGLDINHCPYELKFWLGKEPLIPRLSKHYIEHRSVRWIWDTTDIKPGTYRIEAIRIEDSTKKKQPVNVKKDLAKAKRLSI
jgi:hypothetical protein